MARRAMQAGLLGRAARDPHRDSPSSLAIGVAACARNGNPQAAAPPDPTASTPPAVSRSGADGTHRRAAHRRRALRSRDGRRARLDASRPIGSAVGATGFAIYGAVHGTPPLGGGGGGGGYPGPAYPSGGYPYPSSGYPSSGYPGGDGGGYPAGLPPAEAQREAELEGQLEQEVAKGDALEAEIEDELRRQEDLLKQIEREEKTGAALEHESAEPAPSQGDLVARADPRSAPRAPSERDLPIAIFEEDQRKVPKGKWGNDRELTAKRLVLDADRDGNPELIRYVDPKTGALLYKEEDRDYDGRMDSWTRYEGGLVASIERDSDGDGKIDEWQTLRPRRAHDARARWTATATAPRTRFYEYAGGVLVSERHSAKGGQLERAVYYQDRQAGARRGGPRPRREPRHLDLLPDGRRQGGRDARREGHREARQARHLRDLRPDRRQDGAREARGGQERRRRRRRPLASTRTAS